MVTEYRHIPPSSGKPTQQAFFQQLIYVTGSKLDNTSKTTAEILSSRILTNGVDYNSSLTEFKFAIILINVYYDHEEGIDPDTNSN